MPVNSRASIRGLSLTCCRSLHRGQQFNAGLVTHDESRANREQTGSKPRANPGRSCRRSRVIYQGSLSDAVKKCINHWRWYSNDRSSILGPSPGPGRQIKQSVEERRDDRRQERKETIRNCVNEATRGNGEMRSASLGMERIMETIWCVRKKVLRLMSDPL